MTEIGVGIVGAGWVAGEHIRSFNMHPHSRVAGICSRTRQGAEAKARGDRYFLWDLKRGGHETRSWPVPGLFIGGLFMDEDTFYGASEHGLFVLDIRDNAYVMLTQTTRETGSYRPKCFVKVSDTEFLFDLEGVRIMKASISK